MSQQTTIGRTQSASWDDYLREALSDPEEARLYVEVAIEEFEQDGDMRFFLRALRQVVDAQGGMSKLARETGLNRSNLYKALSEDGAPRLDTIARILRGLGFRLAVVPLGEKKK